jgi:recombination protein RecR
VSTYPKEIHNLINLFSRLPGLGPKSAERLVFYLLNSHSRELAQALSGINGKIKRCSVCGIYTTKDECDICRDPKRDHSLVAVVAQPQDMAALERSGEFTGVYHILGGLLTPLAGVTADDLQLQALTDRVQLGNPPIKELILAFDSNIEGESTALYIKKQFADTKLIITRLARGLPVGADLEYADEVTLRDALKNRQSL